MGTRPWLPGTTKSFGNGWVSVESPSEARVHYLDHLVVTGVVELHHSEVVHPVVPGMVLGWDNYATLSVHMTLPPVRVLTAG